ncbi:MAG: peroxiredoxin [Chlorogloeopsis fritschii C42_A2020_084]|uniref:peroxiredoxin n=1 Tax=Chlorogloeopsis fritschii TaxID=1124 RepID=UPI0019E47D56|nr:peroxiredoxin [Chlorogloeopsis fritschii]MBF2008636.1 peroxiredoxin [Chlorogloeopsis fritschii C42_A2020_084]
MISRRNFLSVLFVSCFALIGWLNFVPTASALGGKLPPINQPAPLFTLPTNSGDGEISLSDLRGKWVVLYFYPKDFTPGCTIEARRFQQDLPKYLEKNTQIIGVSADDVSSHAEFCDSEGLVFPLLADTTGAVSKAYGSWMSFISTRHTFIIDPQGVLRETFVKVNPAIHSQEVLSRLEELQKATAKGIGV